MQGCAIDVNRGDARPEDEHERALQENEETAKALLDTPTDAAMLLDTDGTILGSNETAARELHKRRNELIGLSIWDLLPNESARIKKAFIEEAIRSQKSIRFEDESEGTHNDNIAYPVLNAQGEVTKVALLSRDITKRKQLEARLWRQTHDLEKRVKELTCLYGISDLVQRADLTVGEILQRTADLVPSGWQHADVACARIVLDNRQFPTRNFAETARKQSSDIVVQGRCVGRLDVCYLDERPDKDEGPFLKEERDLINAIAERLGVVIERQRAEQKLRESEEKYRTLFEDSLEAISVTRDGKFVDVNPSWLALHGYEEKAEVIGMDALDVIHPDDRKVLLRRRSAPAGKRPHGYELRDVRKDGKAVEVEVYSSSITLGGETAVLTTVRDVSERARLQSELIQSAKMAAVGTMISGIAHELNNPLAAIAGYAHLLSEDKSIPETSREDIRRILSQSERCAHVVENLLRFARREPAEKKQTDLNEVLANTVDLRRYEMRVTDVHVREEYGPNLPEALVNAHQLQQVFLNIISNAFDAIQERRGDGTITVRTRPDGDRIAIDIEDDGGGIAEIDRIFEPFFTTKEVGKGTGLGLCVAYGIVQEHGGTIHAENTADGARFTIHIPIGETTKMEEEKPQSVVAASPSSGKRILVVDDEEDVAETVCSILGNLGYEVETCYAVENALQRLKTERFDVVITDLIMPGKMTVKDLYTWIRDHLPRLAQHMIFMTGSATGQRTNDLVAGMGCPVIPKPFEIEKLYQIVNGVAAQA